MDFSSFDVTPEDIINSLGFEPAKIDAFRRCVKQAFNKTDRDALVAAAKIHLQSTSKATALLNNELKRTAGQELEEEEAQLFFILIASEIQAIQAPVFEE